MDAELPVLPLRDIVIFPHMVIPLFVGRSKSINAIEKALSSGNRIVLIAQQNYDEETPHLESLYEFGTTANILQTVRLQDGTIKVLIEGRQRCQIKSFKDEGELLLAEALVIEEPFLPVKAWESGVQQLLSQFETYVKLNPKIPQEALLSIVGIEDVGWLVDIVASYLGSKLEDRQALLATVSIPERLEKALVCLATEIDLLEVEQRVRARVKQQIDKSQRDYILTEQLKAIQRELGDKESAAELSDLEKLQEKIETAGLSQEAYEKAKTELNRLKVMQPSSAEASVTRTYLEWLTSLPWKKSSVLKQDLNEAEELLNKEHYGLERVKERILEYLAVTQRLHSLKGQVLCLVGPPGVGKTSLGRSIAQATGREFVRLSLGGMHDEAEIRGHRRTYVGSMPGRIIQKIAKAGVSNPLFLLDEVDKISKDFRGDPASALLEVLDPEQNNTFNDHYLEVDYDLSQVMFIATANSLDIPPALLDRMEVIELSGYTENEKVFIAKDYLIPKQIKENGLKSSEIVVSEDALRQIIRTYTREAGVRNVEREIAKLCRKTVKEAVSKQKKFLRRTYSVRNLEKYLGVPPYRFGSAQTENRIGQVTGLAWTQAGGDLLTIEAAAVPGKGDIKRTGNLENVMLESIDAAVTVIRSHSDFLGINPNFYKELDIHFHVPEGAIKKDGPSAGIAMCVVLTSVLTHIPVRSDVAMTGEITLRGEVLPIGGLKEKLLAALRGGIKHVIIPEDNRRDLSEIPEEVKKDLHIHPVRWIEEVFKLSLEKMPRPTEGTLAAPAA